MESTPATFAIPAGAKLLSIQTQNGNPTLWFMCDPGENMTTRTFVSMITGQEIDREFARTHSYIDTVQINNFVGHIFEKL